MSGSVYARITRSVIPLWTSIGYITGCKVEEQRQEPVEEQEQAQSPEHQLPTVYIESDEGHINLSRRLRQSFEECKVRKGHPDSSDSEFLEYLLKNSLDSWSTKAASSYRRIVNWYQSLDENKSDEFVVKRTIMHLLTFPFVFLALSLAGHVSLLGVDPMKLILIVYIFITVVEILPIVFETFAKAAEQILTSLERLKMSYDRLKVLLRKKDGEK
jgi:hypothetical protein